jgi:transcriptional regulator with XRE-family HTH domain
MTNKEKFLALVSKEQTNTLERNTTRIKNRAMLRESQQIAIKVLMRLEELHWSQKDLATKLEVSPQQVTKIVSGKENLTIETQIKLQDLLNIPILASYYENKANNANILVLNTEKHIEKIQYPQKSAIANYSECKIIKLNVVAEPFENFQLSIK